MLTPLRTCKDISNAEEILCGVQDMPDSNVEETVVSLPSAGEQSTGEPPCASCKEIRPPIITCRNCSSVSYCSLCCFRQLEIEHKFHCRLGGPIDQVDTFVQFVVAGASIKKVEDVAKAFGSTHFTHGAERYRLFVIYCKLINVGRLDDEELRMHSKTINRRFRYISATGSYLQRSLTETLNGSPRNRTLLPIFWSR